MSRRRAAEPDPPCYAMTIAGLEPIAGEEIEHELHGEVKRTDRGLVVFRVPEIDASLLELRTTEDVFLLAWGTDKLTYRAEDLDRIRHWTAKGADWEHLLRIHHRVRPKPKGKPTYRLVTQMSGTHGYRRVDAREALARGLAGKLPASWRHAEEKAAIEIWLTIHETMAVCGLRLSDRTMRHRKYKLEHLPASLRPTAAAAMVRLADARRGYTVLDPMCGAGTLLAEQLEVAKTRQAGIRLWGGDRDATALRAAGANLRRLGPVFLARWDARRLPLPDQSVDRVLSNPPFGKQLGRPEEMGPLYEAMTAECDRVLRPGGQAVLLVADFGPLKEAARGRGWKLLRQLRLRILGQPSTLSAWRKPGEWGRMLGDTAPSQTV